MFFFIPEARVAIQPPTVLNSMLHSVSAIDMARLSIKRGFGCSARIPSWAQRITCQARGRG
jgi:pentose-5-phosphate-3-epimerase